ncbi:helix-turn-helix domain-containing protein [Methylobacterium sp. 37f]|uniref:helix-turn-helix domain-containing protein n=1 Tax=Methylobacterium sp. 37f TaxID=2817058 RepID=UPI001FFCC153|nr:helix-turn-helix domain-containing protein [Methylobacterium sp. 37f]MCK2056337.1 helix-turn-helix domain-containing protein [Methylobacterium sp. 37f]
MSSLGDLNSATAIPTFRIDGYALGADVALKQFQVAVEDVFSVERTGEDDPVVVDLLSWHLGKMMLGVFRGPPLIFRRSAALVATSGLDHILIQLYLEGGFVGATRTRSIRVAAGDICVFDLSDTLETRSSCFANVSLLFPRDEFRPFLQDFGRLHGVVLAAGDPLTDLLGEYLLSLTRRAALLSVRQAMLAAGATVALAGAVLAGQPADHDRRVVCGQPSDLRRIGHYVDAHIADPDLNAAQIASHLGISRSALYRACESAGGVANLIRRRRLTGAALQLADPIKRERISEVACQWGFASAAAFARAFREAFGISPRNARERGNALVAAHTDGLVDAQGFANWMRLLRTT